MAIELSSHEWKFGDLNFVLWFVLNFVNVHACMSVFSTSLSFSYLIYSLFTSSIHFHLFLSLEGQLTYVVA